MMSTINVYHILIFIYSFSEKVDLDITYDKWYKNVYFFSFNFDEYRQAYLYSKKLIVLHCI